MSTYHTKDTQIVSDSQEDSSVHFITNTQTIKADNKLDMKLVSFYSLGMPFVVLGCTLRETGRVLGYSALNLIAGEFAYERAKRNEKGSGFILPDVQKAKDDYSEFQKNYKESDLYKYRKYRGSLSKAVITKSNLIEEVDWDDKKKEVSSTTETIKLQTSVSDSASRISKKASLVGCRIGTVTSVILGVPSYIIGFIYGAATD